ncbi:major capsid protein [Eoetvoesiella caeni]
MSMSNKQVRVIDPILSNIALGYANPENIGFHLFPSVPVRQRGGQVLQFNADSFKRYNARRAPGTNTKRVSFGYAGKPFALHQDSLEGVVPFEHMQDASEVPGLNLGTEAVNEVLSILHRETEIEQAGIALNAGNYGNDNKVTLAGTDQWTDPASDPAAQIREYGEAIRAKVGIRPNTLALSAAGFNALCEHPKILERFKYTSSDSVTKEMLAKLLNLAKVVVGEAVYMSDAESMVDVWGKDAVLAYVPQIITSSRAPSYGYTYVLEGHPQVEEAYSERNAKSWIYPVTYERVPVVTGFASGFLMKAVAA